MKNIIKLILVFILINISMELFALEPSKLLTFTGNIIDNLKEEKYRYVGISYNLNDGHREGWHELTCKIDGNGHFEFTLPDLGKPFKLSIQLANSDATKRLWQGVFYGATGDSLIIKITLDNLFRDSIIVSGVGSGKYNLIANLVKKYEHAYFKELSSIGLESNKGIVKDSIELNSKMEHLHSIISKYAIEKKSLISSSEIDSDMKKIIGYEFAKYSSEWTFRLGFLYRANPTYRQLIARYYLRFAPVFIDDPSDVSIYCPSYLYSLSLLNVFKLMIQEEKDSVDIISYYNVIKKRYNGPIRDRLLGQVFQKGLQLNLRTFTSDTRDSLYKDALETVRVPYIKQSLLNQFMEFEKVKPTSKILETNFFDIQGNKFDTSSLKGKVYLIDSWFLGCSGCAVFHENFENQILPRLKNKKDFVLLSINVDRNKENWIKGITSQKYTSISSINVYTGEGIGLEHPFFKNYNVKGSPWLLLVDGDGKIVRQFQTYSVSEMLELIQSTTDRLEENRIKMGK